MEPSQPQSNEAQINKPTERIPKQVKLAAWLSVFGAIMTGGVASATPEEPIVGPCIGIAVMMAVVCFAIIKYR